MIIHPKGQAKTTLTNVDDAMVQMHALDIRIDKLYMLVGMFELTEDKKIHKKQVEVTTVNGMFALMPNTMYAFDTIHKVEMAEGEKAQIEPRSTLTRNGLIAGSAIYDAGYVGGVNGYIGNMTSEVAFIAKGARIGQFVVEQAETIKLYTGEYNEK